MTTLLSNFYNLPAFMSQGPLNLSNCRVTGSNPDRSIGALAFRGGMTVTGTTFSSLKHGIVTYDRFNTITSNVFEDCREAIFQGGGGPNSVNPLDVTTTLTCNRFTTGSTFSGIKYGLYVEDGVLMNDIGGPANQTNNIPPNANVFPTLGIRPGTRYDINNPGGWVAPPDFVAVRFPAGSTARYYRYNNEFVGIVQPVLSQNIGITSFDCYTDANEPSNPAPNEVEVCPTLGSIDTYFPLRVGVISNAGKQLDASLVLYPNPAKDVLNIEGTSQDNKVWEVTDVLGKRHLLAASVSETTTQLNLGSLPSGLYSIVIDGKTFKFVKE